MNKACHPDLAARLPRAVGRGLVCPHMQRWRQAVWMAARCQSLFPGGQRVNAHAWNTTVRTCWEVCKTQYAKSSPVCFAGTAAGFSMPMRLEHLLVSMLYIHLQGCRCNKLICDVLIPDWFPEFSEGRRMTCSWKKSTICARCWQTAMKRSESRCQHRAVVPSNMKQRGCQAFAERWPSSATRWQRNNVSLTSCAAKPLRRCRI